MPAFTAPFKVLDVLVMGKHIQIVLTTRYRSGNKDSPHILKAPPLVHTYSLPPGSCPNDLVVIMSRPRQRGGCRLV